MTSLPTHEWERPSTIRVAKGNLTWNMRQREPVPSSNAGPLFSRFLKLATKSGDALQQEVLSIAEKYGPLWLCEDHGLPASHLSSRRSIRDAVVVGLDDQGEPDVDLQMACRPRLARDHMTNAEARLGSAGEDMMATFVEPIERWNVLAQQCETVQRIGYQLRTTDPVPAEGWLPLVEPILDFIGVPLSDTRLAPMLVTDGSQRATVTDQKAWVKDQRAILAKVMQQLMRWGEVEPRFV